MKNFEKKITIINYEYRFKNVAGFRRKKITTSELLV